MQIITRSDDIRTIYTIEVELEYFNKQECIRLYLNSRKQWLDVYKVFDWESFKFVACQEWRDFLCPILDIKDHIYKVDENTLSYVMKDVKNFIGEYEFSSESNSVLNKINEELNKIADNN